MTNVRDLPAFDTILESTDGHRTSVRLNETGEPAVEIEVATPGPLPDDPPAPLIVLTADEAERLGHALQNLAGFLRRGELPPWHDDAGALENMLLAESL